MLLKNHMAQKIGQFLVDGAVADVKDPDLKKRVIEAIVDAYVAGYDLAVEECLKDDSKSGDQMNMYLSTLEVPKDGK